MRLDVLMKIGEYRIMETIITLCKGKGKDKEV